MDLCTPLLKRTKARPRVRVYPIAVAWQSAAETVDLGDVNHLGPPFLNAQFQFRFQGEIEVLEEGWNFYL